MSVKVFVRSEYNYDMDKASVESGLECRDESRAIQSQKEEADINTILKRFGVTGHLPATVRLPEYGDYEDVFDFQSAMDVIQNARTTFMSLPAEIRSRFGNDPQAFLEYAANPENIVELEKMGLAIKREVVEDPIVNVRITNPENGNGSGSESRKS